MVAIRSKRQVVDLKLRTAEGLSHSRTDIEHPRPEHRHRSTNRLHAAAPISDRHRRMTALAALAGCTNVIGHKCASANWVSTSAI